MKTSIRTDAKLWVFDRNDVSEEQEQERVYVFGYTWFEARTGALAALQLSSGLVRGREIENIQDHLVEAGSTIVFVDRGSSWFEIVETLRRMSGKEASALMAFPNVFEGPSKPVDQPEPEHEPQHFTAGLMRARLNAHADDQGSWPELAAIAAQAIESLAAKEVECAREKARADGQLRYIEDMPLCADDAASWFTMRNHLTPTDEPCIVCSFRPAAMLALPATTSLTTIELRQRVGADLIELQKRGDSEFALPAMKGEGVYKLLSEQAKVAVRDAEIARLKAEVGMLRGVDCEADGDGPCGACIKCARRTRDTRIADLEAKLEEAQTRRAEHAEVTIKDLDSRLADRQAICDDMRLLVRTACDYVVGHTVVSAADVELHAAVRTYQKSVESSSQQETSDGREDKSDGSVGVHSVHSQDGIDHLRGSSPQAGADKGDSKEPLDVARAGSGHSEPSGLLVGSSGSDAGDARKVSGETAAEIILRLQGERGNLAEQIKRLADFVMNEIPGEPSQNEGAVDCAIRWMRSQLSGEEGWTDEQLAHARAVLASEHSEAGLGSDKEPAASPEEVTRLRERVSRLSEEKDVAYEERNRLVALFASMALALGWKAGIGQHEDPAVRRDSDPAAPDLRAEWDPEWRTLVMVETPEGQASWHFHDSQNHLVKHLPAYIAKWDGHDTPTKYKRLEQLMYRAVTGTRWASVGVAELNRQDMTRNPTAEEELARVRSELNHYRDKYLNDDRIPIANAEILQLRDVVDRMRPVVGAAMSYAEECKPGFWQSLISRELTAAVRVYETGNTVPQKKASPSSIFVQEGKDVVRVERIEHRELEEDRVLYKTKVGEVELLRTSSRAAANEMRDLIEPLLETSYRDGLLVAARECRARLNALEERLHNAGLAPCSIGELTAYRSMQERFADLASKVGT